MNSPPLVLGIDIGTGGVRVLLVDATSGSVVDRADGAWPTSTPQLHWSEQDPELWWAATATAIRRIVDALDAPSMIQAVSFAGQMHGLVLQDDANEVLRPAILWNDQRAIAECDEIHQRLGVDQCIKTTGKPMLTGFTAPTLLWVQNHEPDVASRIHRICLPKDYVRFRATGVHATDVTDASGTGWLDLRTRDWSPEICDALNIDPSWLPLVHESSALVGTIDASGAAATGLAAGTPVTAGAGDQAAAGLACGVVNDRLASVTIGTSGVVFAQTPQPTTDLSGTLHGFCHAVNDQWHVMGCMLAAGGSLQWWRDAIGIHEDFDALIDEIESIPPGAEGLRFLPYLSGERAPHADPRASGAFLGLTMQHDRRHMTRAVLEGIAFGLKDMLELISASGHRIDVLRVAGGATRNPMWLQLLADVFQSRIETVNEPDATAFGAALLASVGAGVYSSSEEAANELVTVTNTIEPEADVYSDIYATWRTLYPQLAPAMHRLSDHSTMR